MDLISVLRFFVRKNNVQRHLITLIDHGPVARAHFADMKMKHARNGFQIFFRPYQQVIRGAGLVRMSPKNNNM